LGPGRRLFGPTTPAGCHSAPRRGEYTRPVNKRVAVIVRKNRQFHARARRSQRSPRGIALFALRLHTLASWREVFLTFNKTILNILTIHVYTRGGQWHGHSWLCRKRHGHGGAIRH